MLIAGGGAAGLMAALSAGASGARVIIADEQQEMGGWLLSETDTTINGAPAENWISETLATLADMPNVTLLPRTTVFAYMDQNYLTLAERVTDHLDNARASATPAYLEGAGAAGGDGTRLP